MLLNIETKSNIFQKQTCLNKRRRIFSHLIEKNKKQKQTKNPNKQTTPTQISYNNQPHLAHCLIKTIEKLDILAWTEFKKLSVNTIWKC